MKINLTSSIINLLFKHNITIFSRSLFSNSKTRNKNPQVNTSVINHNKKNQKINSLILTRLNLTSIKLPLSVDNLFNISILLPQINPQQWKDDLYFLQTIKQSLKQLNPQDIHLVNLNSFLKLYSLVNPNKISKPLLNRYLNYIKSLKYENLPFQQIINIPSQYLKQICYPLLQSFMNKQHIEEFTQLFKRFASLLGKNHIKNIDNFYLESINGGIINLNLIGTIVAIFNQINTKGYFIEAVEEYICKLVLKNQVKINNLMKISLNLLQLNCSNHFDSIENYFLIKISQNSIERKQLQIFIQIMHKFKLGNKQLWLKIQSLQIFKDQNNMIFPIICGLYRNYQYRPENLLKFLQLDRDLNYVKQFNKQQFIQFFMVLYQNLLRLQKNQQKIEYYFQNIVKLIHINSKRLKINHIGIFFKFLYEKDIKLKKQYLIKIDLNPHQQVLLALYFSEFIGMIKISEIQQYQNILKERYRTDIYVNNKRRVIMQEFIRLKLIKSDMD